MFENTEITLERIKLPTFILCLNDETLLILLEILLKKTLATIPIKLDSSNYIGKCLSSQRNHRLISFKYWSFEIDLCRMQLRFIMCNWSRRKVIGGASSVNSSFISLGIMAIELAFSCLHCNWGLAIMRQVFCFSQVHKEPVVGVISECKSIILFCETLCFDIVRYHLEEG